MISGVRSASIYAGDQDRAKRFWTETMGFSAGMDAPMSEEPGYPRWIEVAPPDKSIVLVLFTPPEDRERIGHFSNIIFICDDIQQTHKELSSRGVDCRVLYLEASTPTLLRRFSETRRRHPLLDGHGTQQVARLPGVGGGRGGLAMHAPAAPTPKDAPRW